LILCKKCGGAILSNSDFCYRCGEPVAEENTEKKREYIDRAFFPDEIQIDISSVFPMVVVATMSSGKSTLINALLGKDILPRRNEACTAKVYSLLDTDNIKEPIAYAVSVDDKIKIIKENFADELSNANTDDSIRSIHIREDIVGVLNTERSLLVIDTPGPNNSLDSSHEIITGSIINQLKGGLILYVINSTQLGIKDDKKLLEKIKRRVTLCDKLKILFVINKIDELDFEKESISDHVSDCVEYLSSNGFRSPNVIPVSALAANLFKKVLSGEKLTRNEYRSFVNCYGLFKCTDLRMSSYAVTEDCREPQRRIELNGETYTAADIIAAIENTGIVYLEKRIQYEQIVCDID
jgi:GTPase